MRPRAGALSLLPPSEAVRNGPPAWCAVADGPAKQAERLLRHPVRSPRSRGRVPSWDLAPGGYAVLTLHRPADEDGVPRPTLRKNTERPVTITEGTSTLVGPIGRPGNAGRAGPDGTAWGRGPEGGPVVRRALHSLGVEAGTTRDQSTAAGRARRTPGEGQRPLRGRRPPQACPGPVVALDRTDAPLQWDLDIEAAIEGLKVYVPKGHQPGRGFLGRPALRTAGAGADRDCRGCRGGRLLPAPQ